MAEQRRIALAAGRFVEIGHGLEGRHQADVVAALPRGPRVEDAPLLARHEERRLLVKRRPGVSPGQYDLYFSARYIDDLVTGKATHPEPEQRSDRIYTGFAVRRGVFDAVSQRNVSSMGVIHAADGRPVRWGTELLLEREGQLLRALSVHLKSGCHGGSLESPTDPDCVTLAAQRAPLEAWIDDAAQQLVPFAILGDFNRRIDRFGQATSGVRSMMATHRGWIFGARRSIARPNATPPSRN